MSDIRPGRTAPKAQTILVWGKPKNTKMVRYVGPGWHTAARDPIDGAFCLTGGTWEGPFIKPKFWMPLPDQPSSHSKGAM